MLSCHSDLKLHDSLKISFKKLFWNKVSGFGVTDSALKQLKIWAVTSENHSLTGEFICLKENQNVIQL